MEKELRLRDLVAFYWGEIEVHGKVREVYGDDPNLRVVIDLTPAVSGDIFDETTVVVPIEDVWRPAAA